MQHIQKVVRQYASRRNRYSSGLTMVEVLATIAIFSLVLVMYSATFPPILRNTGHTSNYLQASLIARHKIEQIRQAGYTHLNGTDLQQLGIVDSAAMNTDGSFSFTTTDRLVNTGNNVGYFGANTNARGTILLSQAISGQGTSAPSTRWAMQATVSITWTSGGSTGSYTTATVIAAP